MDYKDLAKNFAYYAYKHLGVDEMDMIYLENLLLNKFNEDFPSTNEPSKKLIDSLEVPDYLINELYSLLGDRPDKERIATEIMGMITPSPSVVYKNFLSLRQNDDKKKALDYLYNLQIKNNYIQKTAIDKNIMWKYQMPDNFIEITINLSKPEKNNKDIAKALLQSKSDIKYPKCLLCRENLGFKGTATHPARQNIRIIPMKLNNEGFFMQYSPYCYYDEHVIIINDEHTPMKISRETFKRHADFVDLIPEYFIGSNADLPIVGGSILSHEHYQGGIHLMPLMYSKDRFEIKTNNPNIKVSYLDWFNSCVCIKSHDKESIIDAMDKLRIKWKDYDDIECDILSFTNNTPHNTITPILRKVNDEYIAYAILRNNRCDEKYPDGIFHAHKEYHNIKKEGIGLIEAMGLFILPGRLQRQCKKMEELIVDDNYDLEKFYLENEDMRVHNDMILSLQKLHPANSKEEIKNYINNVCKNILENTAVFKNDSKGNEHAYRFLKSIEF